MSTVTTINFKPHGVVLKISVEISGIESERIPVEDEVGIRLKTRNTDWREIDTKRLKDVCSNGAEIRRPLPGESVEAVVRSHDRNSPYHMAKATYKSRWGRSIVYYIDSAVEDISKIEQDLNYLRGPHPTGREYKIDQVIPLSRPIGYGGVKSGTLIILSKF